MKVTDQAILDFIDEFHKKHGYAPSMREVMHGVGINSTGAVRYRLGVMRDKGLVTFEKSQPRTLKVVH
jgi:repressor LexA